MRILRDVDWKTLGLELFIVFVGLLAALQVDEWRENREYAAAEERYLLRLNDDLVDTLDMLRGLHEMVDRFGAAVKHVDASLAAGEIIDGDTELFEEGLIRVAHLPSVVVYRSAYDEMVASGMFARLRSEELKRSVANLITFEQVVNRNFNWWRVGPQKLMRDIMPYVTLGYGEGFSNTRLAGIVEPARTVEFDFEGLSNDPIVRNQFYWAADSHSDWKTWIGFMIEYAEDAHAAVTVELESR